MPTRQESADAPHRVPAASPIDLRLYVQRPPAGHACVPSAAMVVRQAYDRSQFWEERKKFMIAWRDALAAESLIT